MDREPPPLVFVTEAEWSGAASVANGRPAWTKGHEPVPCLGCERLTETRSPGGEAWCYPTWRKGRIEHACRTVAAWVATRGKTGGARALGSLFGAAAALPRQNPQPVAAAREAAALEDREGDDVWPEGRE